MLFETERLTIRTFEARDIDALMAYRNDESWMRFQGFKGKSKAEYEAALLSPQTEAEGMQLAVADKTTDSLIGDLYLKEEPDAYMIGYTVSPTHARHGYASEAVRALLQWLGQNRCHTVRAVVMPDNNASVGLLMKLGFVAIGTDDEGDLLFERSV